MNKEFYPGALPQEGEVLPELPEMPELPDGIGVRLEDMVVLLAHKHQTAVALDDPILMVASICNSHLSTLQLLLDRHNEALTKTITARTQEYVTGVKEATGNFSKVISDASVEGIRRIFDDHAQALEASKWNARWCALIMAVSAAASLLGVALK